MSSGTAYMRVAPNENSDDIVTDSKQQMERKVMRDVRDLQNMSTATIFWWFVRTSWPVFIYQGILAALIAYYTVDKDWSVHDDVLELKPGARPYILASLELLIALLTAYVMNESAARFRSSMSALLALKNNGESFRVHMLAFTSDPKLETAVQLFLTWMCVLIRKDIVFYTEDFGKNVFEAVAPEHRPSVLFFPQVLWCFSRRHWEFTVLNFIEHAKLLDPHRKVVSIFDDLIRSWVVIEENLTVKVPRTQIAVMQMAVMLFFFLVPFLYEDTATQVMVPFVSAIFYAMLGLARELNDPWSNRSRSVLSNFCPGGKTIYWSQQHAVPLDDVLALLSAPNATEGDEFEVQAAVEWLNKGLTEGVWDYAQDPKIPRPKNNYPNRGETISFEDMRTLPQVCNRKSWRRFCHHEDQDMNAAVSRGRRMPQVLREQWQALCGENGKANAFL